MHYRGLTFGFIVLSLFTAPPASAQDKHALIQKLVEVSNISGQLQSGAQTATSQIMAQLKKENPTIPDDVFSYVQSKVEHQMSGILSSAMDQVAYPIWEQTFSDAELQAIIGFYSSPTGKKLVEKMPVFMQELSAHLPAYLKESLPKIKNTAIEAAAEKKYQLKF